MTASFGIATYSRDGRTVDELIAAADRAMYAAKADGRNSSTSVSDQTFVHLRRALTGEGASSLHPRSSHVVRDPRSTGDARDGPRVSGERARMQSVRIECPRNRWTALGTRRKIASRWRLRIWTSRTPTAALDRVRAHGGRARGRRLPVRRHAGSCGAERSVDLDFRQPLRQWRRSNDPAARGQPHQLGVWLRRWLRLRRRALQRCRCGRDRILGCQRCSHSAQRGLLARDQRATQQRPGSRPASDDGRVSAGDRELRR